MLINTNITSESISKLSRYQHLREITFKNILLTDWNCILSLPASILFLDVEDTNCPRELLEEMKAQRPGFKFNKQQSASHPERKYIVSQIDPKIRVQILQALSAAIDNTLPECKNILDAKEISDLDLIDLYTDSSEEEFSDDETNIESDTIHTQSGLYSYTEADWNLISEKSIAEKINFVLREDIDWSIQWRALLKLIANLNIQEKLEFIEGFILHTPIQPGTNMERVIDILRVYENSNIWSHDSVCDTVILTPENIHLFVSLQEILNNYIGIMQHESRREFAKLLLCKKELKKQKAQLSPEEKTLIHFLTSVKDLQDDFRPNGNSFQFGIKKITVIGFDTFLKNTVNTPLEDIRSKNCFFMDQFKKLTHSLDKLEELSMAELTLGRESWPADIELPFHIIRLDLSYTDVTREVLYNWLKNLHYLEDLNLRGVKLGESWLSFQKHFPSSLVNLDIGETDVHSNKINTLQNLIYLEKLNLSRSMIRNWDCLGSLPPGIKEVNLSNITSPGKGIDTFRQERKGVKIVFR